MNRVKKRVLVVFLHGADESPEDMLTFFHKAPLESFGDISFARAGDILGIEIACPGVQTDGEVNKLWFNRSPGWRQLGMDDTFEDFEGVNLSIEKILEFLSDVQNGYDYIFLGGFDIGGAMALYMTFQSLHEKVAGIFSIGSFLINQSSVIPPPSVPAEDTSSSFSLLPVLMMHGRDDEQVPIEWGMDTATALVLRQVQVKFCEFAEAEHEIAEEQLHSLLDWMEDILNLKVTGTTSGEASSSGDAASSAESKDGSISLNPQVHRAGEQVRAELKGTATVEDPSHAFLIDKIGDSPHTFLVTYPAEPDMVVALAGRPVLCNGGMFDITPTPDGNGVQCVISSSDPEKTAVAIGERLLNRILSTRDGTSNVGAEVCCIA